MTTTTTAETELQKLVQRRDGLREELERLEAEIHQLAGTKPSRHVRLEHDHDMECPNDMDCEWHLYSFNRGHHNYADPETLGLRPARGKDYRPKIVSRELKAKLKDGLAHWCSYFEHGQSWWGRRDGDLPAGVEFSWDGIRRAGVLIWERPASDLGGKTFAERARDADGFLQRYTAWANGEGWGYVITDENGGVIDSCWGFDDTDYMLSEIAPELVGCEFQVSGEADYLEEKLRELVAKQKDASHE